MVPLSSGYFPPRVKINRKPPGPFLFFSGPPSSPLPPLLFPLPLPSWKSPLEPFLNNFVLSPKSLCSHPPHLLRIPSCSSQIPLLAPVSNDHSVALEDLRHALTHPKRVPVLSGVVCSPLFLPSPPVKFPLFPSERFSLPCRFPWICPHNLLLTSGVVQWHASYSPPCPPPPPPSRPPPDYLFPPELPPPFPLRGCKVIKLPRPPPPPPPPPLSSSRAPSFPFLE